MSYSEHTLQQWSAACRQCLGAIYDICRPFHEPESRVLHPKVRFVVAQLGISCHLTSESTFILVSNRKIWDADSLVRSVLEGTFKYVYILQGSDNDQQRKCNEYWDILPGFAVLTRQKRATSVLENLTDADSAEWTPIRELLVSEEELERASRTTNRNDRQRLSQEWSFSEMAKYFATHNDKRYRGMGCLAYGYGMKSQVVHQDGDGVGLRWERARREDDRRDSIELAHGGRVISDLCHFGFFRAHELFIACKEDPKSVLDIANNYKALFDSISAAANQWRRIEYGD